MPVVWISFVKVSHSANGDRSVVTPKEEPAPLSGQPRSRDVPFNRALSLRGATIWPHASTTGNTLPVASKNEVVLKPASLTPTTCWYSAPHQQMPAPRPEG